MTWNSKGIQVKMAAKGTSIDRVRKNFQTLMTVLKYAACELLLNFLLLTDAVFSYLLTKFARHCKLQIPCILCSRLDHILGNEKPGFYCNLLCSNHRSEISSLFSCRIHGKLADGRGMCEECFLSFAMKTKSNPDMHRLLVGKFGFDISAYGCQSSLLNKELILGATGVRLCSCCNKPWKSRKNADKLLLLKSPRSGTTTSSIPLPHRLSRHEGLMKMRDRFSRSATSCHVGKFGLDPSSHLGYMELKFASDSESEFPFSDDDEGSTIVREMKEPIQHALEIPSKALANSSSKPFMHLDVRDRQDAKCLQSDDDIDCDRRELNLHEAYHKTYHSALSEFISYADFPPFPSIMEASITTSTEKCALKFPLSENFNPTALPELMPLVDAPSPFNVVEGPLEALQWKYDPGIGNTRSISINKHEEIMKSVNATAGRSVENVRVANEVPPINPTYMNQSDVWKSTVNSKENEASDFVSKKSSMKEPKRDNKDMNLSAKNISAQAVGLSPDRIIISPQAHGDESQTTEASSSNGVQILEETVPMEGTESYVESLDGSFVSEIEGENIVDQLKRQVEHDTKCINALYKELEEERSASAIAANQAMAMITRLQEEKAALHMEALQYLRMMEEQAEYDVEALEKANDLLAEKEKELQDLEAELEFFRLQAPDEAALDNKEVSNEQENPTDVRSSLSVFEDEKLFISRCLKDLEKKFRQFAQQNASDLFMSEEIVGRKINEEESLEMEETQKNGEMKENVSNESNHPVSNGQKFSKQNKEIDLITLGNEISDLNERLEALESNWNFLEHTFNSLETGKEGLKFVQEIANQLLELRKTVTKNRCQFVPSL